MPSLNLRRLLLWGAVSALGAAAVAISALHRGEQINALWLVIAGFCTFAVAYRFYSSWLVAKVLVLDDKRSTPAITENDGKDYVPTHKWVVFGHHFAAIAGPGPLVGPVLAAQFGYLPGMLWILIGATLGGGVHDAVVMFSSIRRGGKSIGQMLREEVNPVIGMVAMVSLLAIMTILLAVLGLVVVNALADSPWGLFTIAMTIPLAVVMGLLLKSGRADVRTVTIFGVAGLLLSVWMGQYLDDWKLDGLFLHSKEWLAWSIIIYGFAASVLPVWLLLAPRDYLSTFMKLGTVIVLAFAVILVAPQLHMPAVTKFVDGTGLVFAGPVFPFVFITIACGAISGFHALISSGTTPKMLERESAIRIVGYGAMITEMLVALMALIAACALEPGQYFAINTANKGLTNIQVVEKVNAAMQADPILRNRPVVTEASMDQLAASIHEKTMFGRAGGAPTFAVGMAHMFARAFGDGMLALWYHFAIMFEALFILTTIDAGTRVGRFILQDLLGQIHKPLGQTHSLLSNVLASGLLVAGWGYFLIQGVIDPLGGINTLWPLFGIANQLLAVIAFCLGTTVLIKMGRARFSAVTLVPLTWLVIVTFTAGFQKIFSPDPRLGFASLIQVTKAKIANGGSPEQLAEWNRIIFNNQIDIAVTAAFLTGVAVIVVGCLLEWVQLLRGTKPVVLRESPYVALTGEV
jgi:carbon starvation protein